MFGKKKSGKRWYKDSVGTSHRFKYNAKRANQKSSNYKKRLKKSRSSF